MFRFSLEPREYFDESVNPFKTRNNKGMKTGSKISSIKSQSCSSRRSSIWSQATLQANFEDILEQANELTSTVKFIHLKQNMFKTGGGYIKIKEFLKKNKLIEERKLLGKGATKRLNFVNIPKRAKYSSTTP